MSGYVDVDLAIDEIIKDMCGVPDIDEGLSTAISELRLMPTADVIEVVRCKDCDYSMGITEKKCPMWENIGDPNGYCKWWQSTTIFHK